MKKFKRIKPYGEITAEWLVIPTLSIERVSYPYMNKCLIFTLRWLPFQGGFVWYYEKDFNPSMVELFSKY